MNMLPGLLKNVTFDMQLMILIYIRNTSPARGNNSSCNPHWKYFIKGVALNLKSKVVIFEILQI